MSNGDGSYKEVLGSNGELVTGTSSALMTMSAMNTLSAQNRTTGLSWLASNQLPSGGFGLTSATTDNVGKTWPTLTVALCIQAIGQQSGSMARNVMRFVSLCKTDMGFEIMEPIPSLMWSDWLASISRLSHSEGFSDSNLAKMYADSMLGWSEYPSNVTAATSIEYGPTQYRTQSVWTQYFGAALYAALGTDIPDSAISAAESYVYQCQDSSGHYKPTSFMGTPQMQYTVAAVEALYLMNALNTIHYRANLDSAILAEFVSGHWSMNGWTLRPFANEQSAIDWLCTRAALRLNLLNSSKALQIAQSIKGRIQYTDVWALSRDVATLALLNVSGYQVGLGCINTQAVIQCLGSTLFSTGWLNLSDLWQPVYTAGALEMISILGLRIRLASVSSGSVHATGPSIAEIGSSISLAVSIAPVSGHHDVVVFAFDNWLLFRNVDDTDSIELTIPADYKALGPSNLYIMLRDYGVTRACCVVSLQVRGVLQGSLHILTSILPRGHNANGSVDWSLEQGSSAGQTHALVSLGNGLLHQQWECSALSPLSFSLPTSGFTNGVYDLTVRLDHPYCQNLTLTGQITLLEPVQTYIMGSSFVQGRVNTTVSVPWSLRYSSNGSEVRSQEVRITIKDESGVTALERSGAVSPFVWIPTRRGNYSFVLVFLGNESLVGSYFAGAISVNENTRLEWLGAQVQNQYSTAFYFVKLSTHGGIPLSNYLIQVSVTSPSSVVVLQSRMTTNATGFV
jgi:prenyltransferase beta subunit